MREKAGQSEAGKKNWRHRCKKPRLNRKKSRLNRKKALPNREKARLNCKKPRPKFNCQHDGQYWIADLEDA